MEEKSKYSKALPKELYRKIQIDLEIAMNIKKMYLRQDLTMHQLAKEINTNTSYLSRIIRETYRSNFTTYLNSLRIIEAKKIITNPGFENYTITEIFKKCGYKNKSTFYKAFKYFTGLEPDNYRKNVMGNPTNNKSITNKK
ncbi:MAG: helix-turn-helix domain-containing protein [Prolixibacteraceae bacterium]|nr:helix-turn-helix domain-containing protein [Prolixibacteraceae bacterium]